MQELLTKYVICRPRSVRIGKNCVLGLEYGSQVLCHSFSQYGPPGRQITYIYILDYSRIFSSFKNLISKIDFAGIQ